MNINRIDLIPIPVSDQNAALAFYTEKLGFEVRLNIAHMEDPSIRWIQLAPPGGETHLVLAPWVNSGSFATFILVTSDIESDYIELKEKGIDLSPLEHQPWGISTKITDLDGNVLLLQQNIDLDSSPTVED